jgi:hypothetical protein
MAGPPQTNPTGPSSVPAAVPAGSQYPLNVTAQQLDNPPRTRVYSIGHAAASVNSQTSPFAGLAGIDMFNIKEALQARLIALNADPASNPDHITSTNRILVLVQAMSFPKSPAPGEPIPKAPGVTPMPPVARP